MASLKRGSLFEVTQVVCASASHSDCDGLSSTSKCAWIEWSQVGVKIDLRWWKEFCAAYLSRVCEAIFFPAMHAGGAVLLNGVIRVRPVLPGHVSAS